MSKVEKGQVTRMSALQAARKNWPGLLVAATGVGLSAGAGVLIKQTKRTKSAPAEDAPHIVILGAGFAGFAAARKLGSLLGNTARITLVDRHNYHLFTPMLYQAATLSVDPYNVAIPLRRFVAGYGVTFRKALVTGIDFDASKVCFDNGEMHYDYLVIALGSTTNYFGNHAAKEHAMPLKWLADGVQIRNHVIDMMEKAALTQDVQERKTLLTFVVVGGGATGVETAAALATLKNKVLPRSYPHLDQATASVIVIESEGKLLGHMGEGMAQTALKCLRDMGVEVWLNSKAQDVEPDSVTTADGRSVRAHTIIWSTGVRAPDVVSSMDAEHAKGDSLAVDAYLQVCGKPGVFAAGDNAHFEDPRSGKSAPLLAAAAVQEGEAIAANIAAAIAGREQMPFHYRDMGNVVSLGPRAGVASIGPVVIGGVGGWLIWRLLHLTKLTGFRNKVASALDWSMGYFYNVDTSRLEGVTSTE